MSISYVAEFCPASARGPVLVWMNLFWSVGALVEVAFAWYLLLHSEMSNIAFIFILFINKIIISKSKLKNRAVLPTMGWRWFLAFTVVPTLLVLLFYRWIPESARYNMISGRSDAAMKTLQEIAIQNRSAFSHMILMNLYYTNENLFVILIPSNPNKTSLSQKNASRR